MQFKRRLRRLASKLVSNIKNSPKVTEGAALVAGALTGFAIICWTHCSMSADASAIREQARPSVIKLTPPSTKQSGGTGFQVKTPSGRTYTLTNGHICAAAENGILAAWPSAGDAKAGNDRGRSVYIRVIEVSEATDLCLAEPIPGAEGLEVADEFDIKARAWAVGHPLLNELTVSEGFAVNRERIELLDEETPKERCLAPSRRWESIDTFFGSIEMCVRVVEAWNSSLIIFPGSSGSPVLNANGEVIGVIFAGDRRSNYGSFVPLEDVQEFLSLY